MMRGTLGCSDLQVSAIGLGCMGMSEWYGPTDDGESAATVRAALDAGVNFFDTADVYGNGHNETLLGRALGGRREEAVIATKFGFLPGERGVCGRPEYVRQACDASLRRLGIERIDLYYLHRIDPEVPLEETIGAMAGLVREGKVRHIGLSEASPRSLRRACAVHPVAALQTEYSVWVRHVEAEILPACRELNIALVSYSPLGRGFLTGTLTEREALGPDDFRASVPLFAEANFESNRRAVTALEEMAAARGCTAAQVSLAWLLARGGDVFPIPGTKRRKYLLENVQSARIFLTPDEVRRIDNLAALVRGARKSEPGMRLVDK